MQRSRAPLSGRSGSSALLEGIASNPLHVDPLRIALVKILDDPTRLITEFVEKELHRFVGPVRRREKLGGFAISLHVADER